MNQRRPYLSAAVLAAFLLFYLFVAWTVFYSPIDDFRWGIDSIGPDWWLNAVYNRRYVGNFFAVVMTRSTPAKTLIIGLHMFALPLLMALLATHGKKSYFLPLFLFCNAGLLLMSPHMWRETYYWVSGFGNFVIPTVYFLAWLLILRRLYRDRRHLIAWTPTLFLFTLALGLFIENLTLLFFGAALILAVYALWDRALIPPFWACLLGSGLALALMLTHTIYGDLSNTGAAIEGYRQLVFDPSDPLPAIAADVLGQFARLLARGFVGGFHIAAPLSVIIAVGFWRGPLRPACALAALPLGLAAAVLTDDALSLNPAVQLLSCLAWGLALPALLFARAERYVWLSRLLLFAAAAASLLFLSVTNSEPWRSHFFAMTLLILVAASISAPFLCGRPAAILSGVAALLLALRWGVPCAQAAACTQLRAELIRSGLDSGAQTLVLPTDDHQYTLWAGRNPWAPNLCNCYRRLHHIPNQVTMIFLPPGSFETWPEIAPEAWEARLEFGPDFNPPN